MVNPLSVGGNINININFGGTNEIGRGGNLIAELLSDISQLLSGNADSPILNGDFFNGTNSDYKGKNCWNVPAPVETPVIEESSQPVGSLKTEGNVITTAGGYKIEMLGKQEWKITGPDGKSTRIWGDPHVDESDGGKFDFKHNTTFALPDGTKINVTTVPYGNGETVTGKIEVISGNDRVVVTDVDKGLGKIGTITQDGFASSNSFLTEDGKAAEVFVMGQESDDWSFQGREIIGNDGATDKFKLGGQLNPLDLNKNNGTKGTATDTPPWAGETVNRSGSELIKNWLDQGRQIFADLFQNFNTGSTGINRYGSNPYTGSRRAPWQENGNRYDRADHYKNLAKSYRQMARMFDVIARLSDLSTRLNTARNSSRIA